MTVGNNLAHLGWQSAFGIAKQETITTFVTSTSFIEFNSESFKQEREEIKLGSINSGREMRHRLIGNEAVSGSMEADLDPTADGLMLILKNAFGGTVSSVAHASSASTFVHTFNVGDMENNSDTATSNDTKGLSIAVRKGPSNTWDFSGMRVNSLSIKGEVGGPTLISAEMIGLSATSSSTIGAVAISHTNVNPVNFTGVTLNTGDSITNVSAEYFTAFELVIANNLDGDGGRVLGSRNPAVVQPGQRDITLTLTQRFDTITAYNRFESNTLTAVSINLDNQQTLSSASVTSTIVLNMPQAYWNSTNPEVGGKESLVLESEVSAIFDATATYDIQAVVTNLTTSYP